jgi:hypothetical protein
MRYKILIVSLLAIILGGCGGAKKTSTPPPKPTPNWVSSRPSSAMYYYGIGAARITSDPSQYQQAARQNALADMSSEISISISSNSVLHAFESNLNFREDFTSTIKAQTQQDLEGYELVDSWEDLNNYWVFYRLSKAEFNRLKELRKNNAVTRSLDLFSSGIIARNTGSIRVSLVQLIKALEPIKPYFSEPLPVEYNGSQIFLGNEIFKELSTTIAAIEIAPIHAWISAKTGQSISSTMLKFEARHKQYGIIAELPLVVNYTERPLRNNKQRTASNGIASFDIDVVRSTKAFETFSASIDTDDILIETGVDPFVRRLITRFNLPQGTIRINIEKPVFAIISNEVNLGEVLKPGILEEGFKQKAIESGYQVKTDAEEADYIVRITAATSNRGVSGQFENVGLEGLISVKTKDGNQLYHKNLEGIIGRHFEHNQAGLEAYREARRRVEVTFFREIHEAINKR